MPSKSFVFAIAAILSVFLFGAEAFAQAAEAVATPGAMTVTIPVGGDGGSFAPALRITLLLLALSMLPAMLVSVTSFTRIVVVLGFVKQSLGTQSLPPSQVLVGLSLFLTLFTMSPVLQKIQVQAYEPYQAGQLNDEQALDAALVPLRDFMAHHTRPDELRLMLSMTQDDKPQNFNDVSTFALVPAFMLSELRAAFIMGAMIFIPFIVIDLVVASVLMAMGMMMVPPAVVSLPIKLILFVLADGWNLVVGSLVRSIMGGQ
jgi:flagellar biosynthetic protein FliP